MMSRAERCSRALMRPAASLMTGSVMVAVMTAASQYILLALRTLIGHSNTLQKRAFVRRSRLIELQTLKVSRAVRGAIVVCEQS